MLGPWMVAHLDEAEAYRRVGFTVGILDICQRKHTDALMLQQLLDNLAAARRGEFPWLIRDGDVFVEATYRRWWNELRIGKKAASRVLNRLETEHQFISRRTFQTDDKRTALHIHVREANLQLAWTMLMENGVYDPQAPE